MSTQRDAASGPAAGAPGPARRPQTNVRTLIALVACCAVVFWAWRHVTESSDPVALSIQKRAIGALRSDDPSERLTAIVELERLGFGNGAVAVPALVGALDDPDMAVRVEAARALGAIVPTVAKSRSGGGAVRGAAAALVARLDDKDQTFRETSIIALGAIGSSAAGLETNGETVRDTVAALMECLADPRPRARALAVSSLGNIVWPNRAFARSSPDHHKAVLGKLAGMLRDQDAKVRLAAIKAMALRIGRTAPPGALAEALNDESAENRAAAVREIQWARQGLDPWAPMLLDLAEHDPEPSVREQCFWALNFGFKPPAITPAAIPDLIAGLRSNDREVRAQAAEILGRLQLDARAAIPELLRVLNELPGSGRSAVGPPFRNSDPSRQAAFALGQIAPRALEAKQVVAALIEAMSSIPSARRIGAIEALGEFGPAARKAAPALIRILREETSAAGAAFQASAALALGNIAADTESEGQAVAALLPLLQSQHGHVRKGAIKALGLFGPKAVAAVPALRAFKDDRDSEIRAEAARALSLIE